ncbi:MAG: hypothetical protein JSW66_06700 [Phycisphaerales bacterium]|nr:MAG: hypothetical protein JSW66_06700 [Phycisphaerales bacterium]
MSAGGIHPWQLHDDARIAVIGGGPAGCFFALHALSIARQRGLRIQVVIFEGKDFTQRGPTGCNKCAGILSSRLLRNLHDLQLKLPPHIIMSEIQSYVLHLEEATVEISRPEPWRRIVSVYRGAGPRLGNLPPAVSFDSWLLDEVQQRGVQLTPERVIEVRTAGRPVVVTRNSALTCDLVVLATGVNSRPVQLPDLNYVPPTTEIMSQDELLVSGTSSDQRIHIFFGHSVGALFAGLIPKGRFINVSLLDHKLKKDNIGPFLEVDEVQAVLATNPRRLCGCNPRIAVSAALNFYADRFVAIGDAAVTRLYKDGIGSAFLTARQAARTALEVGVSEATFRQEYAPFCQGIDRDNRIGRVLFTLWNRIQGSRRLSQAWLDVLIAETELIAAEQYGRRALWSMFTGDDSYQTIARHLLSRSVFFGFLVGLLRPGLWSR